MIRVAGFILDWEQSIPMIKHLKKVRKSIITREELIADAVFLLVPALLSFLVTFSFDIHHSFYEWPFSL